MIGKKRDFFFAAILSVFLIVGIAALTNSLDTQKYSWDFRYYIAMAQSGFGANNLASPFAYRYLTPFISYFFIHFFNFSVERSFRIIAYAGAFLQLFGVFWFTQWFTHSIKGAYVALVVTAFSLFNVKFLFFDIYRPDHLAYALILLQTYFAFERKFWLLFLITLVASQIREFNIIPLIAYLFAFSREKEDRPIFIKEILVSCVGLVLAIGLPRILIPVTVDYQFVSLTLDGILRALIAPFVLTRDINFIFTLLAYLLPALMLLSITDIKLIIGKFSTGTKSFLMVYTILVLIFSFLGGTDFYRFSTYLFLPQIIIIGWGAQVYTDLELFVMLVAVFIFNRIWLPFPMDNSSAYQDFYGGFATQFDTASFLRIIECFAFVILGFLVRKLHSLPGSKRSFTT